MALLLAAAVPLLGLATITLVVQQRTAAMRSDLATIAEPARELSQEVQYQLTRQMALLRGLALTRERRFLAEYVESRERERELWPELHVRAALLGEEPAAVAVKLEEAAERWRSLVDPDALALVPVDPAAVDEAELEDLRYEAVLRVALELEDAIARGQSNMVTSIVRLESAAAILTYIVVVIALAGSLAAAWYLGKSHAYAAEAEARRREAARQASARNRLMRGLSHDVKNPLSAAAAYSEMLQMRAGPRLEERERMWLDRIGETLRTAFVLLDDLVTLSRLEAGELEVQVENVDLLRLLETIMRTHEAAFQEANVYLEFRVAARLPIVRTSARRVEQVVTNLLTNARKYTPEGGRATLSAGVELHDDPTPREWIAVRVADTGPGIPAEQQEAVFGEFTRLDPDRASGHGLGLAISRSVAQALGGRLTLESEPGAGSTFTLWLPLDASGPGTTDRRDVTSGGPRVGRS